MMVGGDEPRHLDEGLRNWALFSSCSFLTGHLPGHPSSIAIPPTQGVLCSLTIQGRGGVGKEPWPGKYPGHQLHLQLRAVGSM